MLLLSAADFGWSQTTAAQILGAVIDSSGAHVQGASVRVINEGTNDTRRATSDQLGNFIFPQLQVGKYTHVSWVKGRHLIIFGGEIERLNLRHEMAFGPEGSFTFSGQFTQGFDGTNLIPGTGNVIEDYLLGFPSAANAQALPFAKNAKGIKNWVLGGELNSILALQTGLPFYVTSTDFSNTALTFGARPNRLCNGNLPAGQSTVTKWFDTSCFAQAPLNTYGNGGVFYLDTDGNKNEDIGVFKDFDFTEHRRLQFRNEAFNLFNNTNYNLPRNNVSTPSTFGKVPSAQPARVMHLSLKLYF